MGIARAVWITRHGNRHDFVDSEWAKTAERPYDPPLAEDGFSQADELSRRLASENISHIFCSPFLRCIQTANPVAERLNLRIKVEWGLAEWLNPDWFPCSPDTLSFQELAHQFPRIDPGYASRVIACYPESAEGTLSRVARSATLLTEEFAGNLLLVGHGASVHGAVVGLLEGSGERVAAEGVALNDIHYCCLFKVIQNGAGWSMELNGDTSHLSAYHGGIRFH